MEVKTIQEGSGPRPQKGQNVTVHYTGRLPNGQVFDSSVQRGDPFRFRLGVGQVIKCWDQGIAQLNVNQKAQLICPPDYAYGPRGIPGSIPPNATLIFDVELLKFQ
eukprot:403371260